MPSIRKTKTASGATAVQVVRYEKRKVVVLKHVGSAKTDGELVALIESAAAWVRDSVQQTLFAKEPRRHIALSTARLLGVDHVFARDALLDVARTLGFETLASPLLLDLAIMRIVEPSSKLRAIELLDRYFGVRYAERTVYRTLPKLAGKKAGVEAIAVSWAKQGLSSDLSLVLYDVTTLYFETFEADDLRRPGFSKDNKPQQPQIVVGLLVTREGFPLGYEVFDGNTFEGHTMLPVLRDFAQRHGVETPTVVADAGMLSRENIRKLKEEGYSYIVGARLANAPDTIVEQICAALNEKDGATVRATTEHGDLVCAFSAKRYRKDKADMDAQIKKAEALVAKGEPGRRARFVRKTDDAYDLDEALKARATRVLGIKGYYTNIPECTLGNEDVVARYRDLWHVEAAFRMSKSDLAARPVFVRAGDAVRAHMLICFVALMMGRHIEMKTGLSLRAARDTLWNVADARILDTATGETITLRTEVNAEAKSLAKKIGSSY